MIAPAFYLHARDPHCIRLLRRALPAIVIEPCKSSGGLRSSGEKLAHLIAVNPKIGKTLIRQSARKSVNAANRLILSQCARIKVELLDHLHQNAGRKRALIALDQIEIAGRNAEHSSHRRLRLALLLAQTAQGGACKDRLFCHSFAQIPSVNIFTVLQTV